MRRERTEVKKIQASEKMLLKPKEAASRQIPRLWFFLFEDFNAEERAIFSPHKGRVTLCQVSPSLVLSANLAKDGKQSHHRYC